MFSLFGYCKHVYCKEYSFHTLAFQSCVKSKHKLLEVTWTNQKVHWYFEWPHFKSLGHSSLGEWVWGSDKTGLWSPKVWWKSSCLFSSTDKGVLTAHLSTGPGVPHLNNEPGPEWCPQAECPWPYPSPWRKDSLCPRTADTFCTAWEWGANMPFSWVLWWWFLSSLKRKIKSYQGEGCKHKSSLSRWGGWGQRGSL